MHRRIAAFLLLTVPVALVALVAPGAVALASPLSQDRPSPAPGVTQVDDAEPLDIVDQESRVGFGSGGDAALLAATAAAIGASIIVAVRIRRLRRRT